MSDKKDIYTLLNEIYKAYVDKDCQKLRKLLDEAEKVDPANVYLVKYKNLYSQLCGGPIQKTNQFEIKGKPLKYMGKTIKCPHCGAPLIETDYNKKILQDYKAGKINVLKFKCSYCGTEFIWHYTGIKPLFLEDIRVGGEYNIFDRKYKVAGVVQYSGVWEENGEKGNLVYNEYLLYDQRGDIWRFSESVASWPGGKEEEIELSRKSNLSGQIEDITDNYVQINGKKIYFKEKDSVVVKKVYGELGKGYKIGEKVKLYSFDWNGKEYVLEKEETASNKEANIYQVVKKVSLSEMYKKLNKTLSSILPFVEKSKNNDNFIGIGFIGLIVAIMIFPPVMILIYLIGLITLLIAFVTFVGYTRVGNIVLVLISFILPAIIGYKILYKNFTPENTAFLNNYQSIIKTDKSKVYKLDFGKIKPHTQKFVKKYDSGGKEYKYTYYNGFYFKITDQKDLELFYLFAKDLLDKKPIYMPIDKNGRIQLDLREYVDNMILQKGEFKNILGF